MLQYPQFARTVGFDTETHLIPQVRSGTGTGKKKAYTTVESIIPRFVCATFSSTCQDGAFLMARKDPLGPAGALDQLLAYLGDPDTVVAVHNLAFDVGVMLGVAIELGRFDEVYAEFVRALAAGQLRCTMLREKLLLLAEGRFFDPTKADKQETSASLAAAVKRRLGVELSGKEGDDIWRLKYNTLDAVASDFWPADAVEYAMQDAVNARDLFEAQEELLANFDYLVGTKAIADIHEAQKSVALHLLGCHGVRTDRELVLALRDRVFRNVDSRRHALVKAGVMKHAIKKGKSSYSISKKQLATLIEADFTERGLAPPRTPPTKTFPEGQISSSVDKLVGVQDPALVDYVGMQEDAKMLGTVVPQLYLGSLFTVCPHYTPLLATGRTSAKNPTVQILPRSGGARECFVPTTPKRANEPWVLISCDYSAQELVTHAQNCLEVAGYSKLAELINARKDPHIAMACSIMSADHKVDVPYDLAMAVLKGKPCDNPFPWLTKSYVKSRRQMAKAANFGFPGGLGVSRFVDYAQGSYGVSLTEAESRGLQQNWRKTFPENNTYRQYIESLKRGEDFVITHASGMVRADCAYTDASNNLFQGRAALMSTRALIAAVNECLTPGTELHGCRPYAFVHDEILLAAPLSRASDVAKRLREIMRAAGQEICPDVRSDAPPAYAFRWYKAMEEVWSGDTLLPWVPNVTDGKGNWNRLSPGEQPDKGWHWEDPWEVLRGLTPSTIPEGVSR